MNIKIMNSLRRIQSRWMLWKARFKKLPVQERRDRIAGALRRVHFPREALASALGRLAAPERWERWRRLARARRLVAGASVLLALLLALIVSSFLNPKQDAIPKDHPATVVGHGPLTISVVESGTLRPRKQIILRNDLDRDSTIVSIVKEGSVVKQGDLLVELDATRYEDELVERRIRVLDAEAIKVSAVENFSVVTNQAQADVEQAQLNYEFAKLDLDKFVQGEYPRLVKQLVAHITVAEEESSQAEETLRWSQTLFKEKYLAQSNLQKDELAAKKARLNVELAIEELTVTTNFLQHRQLSELQSKLKQSEMALERARGKSAASVAEARAKLRAAEAGFEEEKARVNRIQAQIARARIHAPTDGMVLYASSISDRGADDRVRIQQGAVVEKRREIIYLPTAESFDVDIRVPEVNLAKIRRGLPARVVLDALPGRVFAGEVQSIAPLPDSQSRWMNPNLKLYVTVIALEPAEATLRNGMSCRAEILIEEFSDALYVPIQSVVQQDGQSLVYLVNRATIQPVPVELGLDNSRVVQIVSGLQAGQTVLLTPPLGAERRTSRNPPVLKPPVREKSPGQPRVEIPGSPG